MIQSFFKQNPLRDLLLLPVVAAVVSLCGVAHAGSRITFDESGVMSVDGKPRFVISVSLPPPPGAKTTAGGDAYAELRSGGVNYVRVPPPAAWNDEGMAEVQRYLDAAAAARDMLGWISLKALGQIKDDELAVRGALLRNVLARFKDHPGNGGYKGSDEPPWAKIPVGPVRNVYQIAKEVDPDHPVMVLHAPKFKPEVLSPYMPFCDVTGEDIFPIAYPGGGHSDLPNKQISVVADETDKIMKAAGGKPVWMALQIAFSGTAKPHTTLRFPSFPQERYMTYAAIIHGARGINYFGGSLEQTLSDEDRPFGWNWRFWQRVLRPVLEEIGDRSPLYPALLVPDSKLPVKVETMIGRGSAGSRATTTTTTTGGGSTGAGDSAAGGVDFCVREVGGDVFILAARREAEIPSRFQFSGLPADVIDGEVLFEPPRRVKAANGTFTDWFAGNDVHVYRLTKKPRGATTE
jgi:hypothetical protein